MGVIQPSGAQIAYHFPAVVSAGVACWAKAKSRHFDSKDSRRQVGPSLSPAQTSHTSGIVSAGCEAHLNSFDSDWRSGGAGGDGLQG